LAHFSPPEASQSGAITLLRGNETCNNWKLRQDAAVAGTLRIPSGAAARFVCAEPYQERFLAVADAAHNLFVYKAIDLFHSPSGSGVAPVARAQLPDALVRASGGETRGNGGLIREKISHGECKGCQKHFCLSFETMGWNFSCKEQNGAYFCAPHVRELGRRHRERRLRDGGREERENRVNAGLQEKF
jgi:hypothetical protein